MIIANKLRSSMQLFFSTYWNFFYVNPYTVRMIDSSDIQFPITITATRYNYWYNNTDFDTRVTITLSHSLPVDLTINYTVVSTPKANITLDSSNGSTKDTYVGTADVSNISTKSMSVILKAGSLSRTITATSGLLAEAIDTVSVSCPTSTSQCYGRSVSNCVSAGSILEDSDPTTLSIFNSLLNSTSSNSYTQQLLSTNINTNNSTYKFGNKNETTSYTFYYSYIQDKNGE